ncbi:MAG: DUF1287 domain-containing protein [Parvibaculum sp.]|uniref:DUF1287 domain-containing protein n=1 Tax=Parvibaculum sp. TaxID=2024848 RepID=UPI0032EB5307
MNLNSGEIGDEPSGGQDLRGKRMISRRAMVLGLAALPPVLALPARLAAEPAEAAGKLVEAARAQIGVTLFYDGAYRRLPYPGGDVEPERGVCTDVVVRAYRAALGADLQRLVHEDMAANFSAYPANWGLTRPDRNIDHRRVPNLATFFRRQGAALAEGEALAPGDLVTQTIGGRLPHISVVSDKRVRGTARHYVIHNIGGGAEYADILTRFPVTGRFRYRPV